MTRPGISDGDDAVLDGHNFFRDGSIWRCQHCPVTQPFPSPMPKDAGPCRSRRWGDGPDPMARPCRCGAEVGERCFDGRTAFRRRETFHDGR